MTLLWEISVTIISGVVLGMTPQGDRRASSTSVEVTIYFMADLGTIFYGQAGDDRLFGGTLNDQLWEGCLR